MEETGHSGYGLCSFLWSLRICHRFFSALILRHSHSHGLSARFTPFTPQFLSLFTITCLGVMGQISTSRHHICGNASLIAASSVPHTSDGGALCRHISTRSMRSTHYALGHIQPHTLRLILFRFSAHSQTAIVFAVSHRVAAPDHSFPFVIGSEVFIQSIRYAVNLRLCLIFFFIFSFIDWGLWGSINHFDRGLLDRSLRDRRG